MANPLVADRDIDFLLYEVVDVERLCALDAFEDHSRETFDMFLQSVRRVARQVLYPAYRPMDDEAPELVDGSVRTHPLMQEIYPQLVGLGILTASRPPEVGGAQLPLTVASLASGYLMAGNLSAYAYAGLTQGAARLIESFGSEALQARFMEPMYEGRWTGTMALTEPQAGSSLSDVATRATQIADGVYSLTGTKIFLSGGDQDFTENIVHLTLARIDGAPAGVKGISLFAVPKLRPEGDDLVPNDVSTAGVFHKVGWRGIPSIALNLGDNSDCKGWLVGEPHQGLKYMFQMMNEARLMVGMNGAASASAAYHEALDYARTRPQGRTLGAKDPTQPQVPIIEHAEVRRLLLRQKAIVEGAFGLLATVSMYADLEDHGADEATRREAGLMVELLTPVAKSFPAERGFEANTLAIQIHGGYGYTTEYLPERWWRDQKLNSIHEGTTQIQGLDLLGRKVVTPGALEALTGAVDATIARARQQGLDEWSDALQSGLQTVGEVTMTLGGWGLSGDVQRMMRHSHDFLDLFGTFVVAWQWLEQAAAATEARREGSADFYAGKLASARYWMSTELPRIEHLARLCTSAEDSYATMQDAWF